MALFWERSVGEIAKSKEVFLLENGGWDGSRQPFKGDTRLPMYGFAGGEYRQIGLAEYSWVLMEYLREVAKDSGRFQPWQVGFPELKRAVMLPSRYAGVERDAGVV